MKASTVLKILKHDLVLPDWTKSASDPYETLVLTVISQNTTDHNTAKAYENLKRHFEINPRALAKAEIGQIEEAIKVAGLHQRKAKSIKRFSEEILHGYTLGMESILRLPLEDARKALMEFQGVGPKTADVVLLFSGTRPTIPVDTHVERVTKRLGLAPEKAGYEVVRSRLQALFKHKDYLAVHLSFIAHGRKTCRAHRPFCQQCSINNFCPSNRKWK